MVNPATAALFDMEPSQLIGRTPAELYDPGVSEIIGAHDKEVIESGRFANYSECFVIDGEEYYLDVTRFPLLDHRGNVNGVCSIARETTHRFLHLIFDSIAHAIFTVDSEGTVTSFNRAGEELTGYRRDEVIGRACSSIFRSDRCEGGCPLKETIDTGERSHDQEAKIITKSGQLLPISISTAALRAEGGRIVGGVEMFRDIRLVTELRKQVEKSYVFEDIVSKSQHMKRLFETLPLVADSQSTVLIEGESGTGKELVARAIHNLGPRRDGPFVAINCAAVPDSLIESELFGYEKGAFTDAKGDKPGRFALAKGGTLLLDEIGDLSKQMQVKLLRVLQEKEYEPLGSTQVPSGPLLPAQRRPAGAATPSNAEGGHFAAGPALHRSFQHPSGAADHGLLGARAFGTDALPLSGKHPRAGERDRARVRRLHRHHHPDGRPAPAHSRPFRL
jgi:PAS domain S-box-containing protein